MSALDRVHTLYVLQVKLLQRLRMDLTDPALQRETRREIQEFKEVLKDADWRYMGGEDVYEALQNLPVEVTEKLRETVAVVAARDRKVTLQKAVSKSVKNAKAAASAKKTSTKPAKKKRK